MSRAHADQCCFDSEGILSPDCPACNSMILEPTLLPEKFEYFKRAINSICPNCDSKVEARINGLHPHGISLLCNCL